MPSTIDASQVVSGVLADARLAVGNIAEGVSVTQAFAVVPAWNLPNAVDEDIATATTEGQDASSGEVDGSARFRIDLGAVYFVSSIWMKFGLRTTVAGTVNARLRAGMVGDLTDGQVGSDVSTTSLVQVLSYIEAAANKRCRYIALRAWYSAGGGNEAVQLYEVVAFGKRVVLG